MTARRSPCSRTAMGSRSATVLEATPGAGPAGTVAVSIALLVRDSDARGGRHRARRLSQSKQGTNQVSGVAATDGGALYAGCLACCVTRRSEERNKVLSILPLKIGTPISIHFEITSRRFILTSSASSVGVKCIATRWSPPVVFRPRVL